MTKRFIIAAVVLVLVAVLGIATMVNAQAPVPPTPGNPNWQGGMMGRGGMMGGRAAGTGAMHDYMEPILAAKLGMTEEELEQANADGKTFWQIAGEKGLTDEQALQAMTDARSEALDAMVKDNVITQEQADWMKTRMGGRMGAGMGYGAGGCMGGRFSGSNTAGAARGGRW